MRSASSSCSSRPRSRASRGTNAASTSSPSTSAPAPSRGTRRADAPDGGGESAMLRVTLRGSGVPTAVLGSGETLLFGRSPSTALPELDPAAQLRHTALTLPRCAPHVSRLLGELVVGDEMVRLRWRGGVEAQLSSLFDAPGGARRVTLVDGMSALLDEGENRLVVLRGRLLDDASFADLTLAIDVSVTEPESGPAPG